MHQYSLNHFLYPEIKSSKYLIPQIFRVIIIFVICCILLFVPIQLKRDESLFINPTYPQLSQEVAAVMLTQYSQHAITETNLKEKLLQLPMEKLESQLYSENKRIHPVTKKEIEKKSKLLEKNHLVNLPTPKEKIILHHVFHNAVLHHAGVAAERLLMQVRNTMHHLKYSYYKLGGTYFNTLKGIYGVDCSDYVDHLLSSADPLAYKSLEHWTKTFKPTSEDYYIFFDAMPNASIWHYWYKVTTVRQLQPGDILVFRYKNLLGRDAYGHVMIVVDAPVLDRHERDAYMVRVSDSAPIGHSDDTRRLHTSGIGIGTLLLKVNPKTGGPEAYAWSLGARWEYDMDFAMAKPMSIF